MDAFDMPLGRSNVERTREVWFLPQVFDVSFAAPKHFRNNRLFDQFRQHNEFVLLKKHWLNGLRGGS